ncbi:PKD-like family lipoprotein [Bacteroidota bacterium]
MIKNIKIQFIFLLGCFIIMNSCNTDEGNYNYTEINEVVFEGLQDNYVALRFDNLNIVTDAVKFTEDPNVTGQYEYSWEAVSKNPLDDNIYQISTKKDMDDRIVLVPGEYTLYYSVKDLNTDVKYQYKTELEVVNSIYKGWMVLNDVAGESRLDMVTWLEGDEFREIHDVLDFAESSLTLTGTPGFVQCYAYDPNFYGVYVSTSGNGTTKLEPDTFDWKNEYRLSAEFVSNQPENLEASVLAPKSGGYAVVIANDNLYIYQRLLATLYGQPMNITRDIFGNTSSFEVSPYIGIADEFGFYKMVFYDNTNKKFKVHDGRPSTSYCSDLFYTPKPGDVGGEVFTPGKDLVYMTSNSYGSAPPFGAPPGSIFAILKDPTDNKTYIGRFLSWFAFEPKSYNEVTATNFEQAEHIAIDPTFAYIMYNVGSKVYEYDIFTGTTVEMLDKGNLEITKLEYGKFINSGTGSLEESLEKQLIVCTYDAAGTEGSNGVMELYKVPAIQGPLELQESFTGFGKIVSVSYRAR